MIISGMAEIREIVRAVVGGAVADEAGAVEDEADGQLRIAQSCTTGRTWWGGRRRGRWVGRSGRGREGGGGGGGVCAPALEEGRVDGAERLDALDGEAGGEGHRVLLRNPDVIRPLGEAFAEAVDAGAARHCGGDRHNRAVVGDVDERVGEDGGVRREALASSPGGREGGWGERRGEVGRRRWGGAGAGEGAPSSVATSKRGTPWYLSEACSAGVAEALLRLHVEEDGLVAAAIADVLKDGHQVVHVVAVDGADVVNPSSKSVPPDTMPRAYSSMRAFTCTRGGGAG